MKKKGIRMTLVAKGCRKDFGLGKGILAQEECFFTDKCGHGFDSPMFASAILREQDEFVARYVKVNVEEIPTRGRKVRGKEKGG